MTLTDKIKVLLKTGRPNREIAKRLGCKASYVTYVKWLARNERKRRDYWRNYSSNRYANDPAFRERNLAATLRYQRKRAESV